MTDSFYTHSNDGLITFAGGLPIYDKNKNLIGASCASFGLLTGHCSSGSIGCSSGTGEEDVACASARCVVCCDCCSMAAFFSDRRGWCGRCAWRCRHSNQHSQCAGTLLLLVRFAHESDCALQQVCKLQLEHAYNALVASSVVAEGLKICPALIMLHLE